MEGLDLGKMLDTSLTKGGGIDTMMKVATSIAGGRAKRQAAKFEAGQLEAAGRERFARGTREAGEAARQSKILLSNIRAAQAGMGGVTTDPGAIQQLGRAGAEGEYNVLAALYEGEVGQRGLQAQAAARRMEGKQAERAGIVGALGTALKYGSKVYREDRKKKKPTGPKRGY